MIWIATPNGIANWDLKYVLIEYCSYADSELSKPIPQSEGCYSIRCAINEDMTDKSNADALIELIDLIPRDIVVCVWSSIPCAGGFTLSEFQQA